MTYCGLVDRNQCSFFPWRWRQLISLKYWHLSTRLNAITSQKTIISFSVLGVGWDWVPWLAYKWPILPTAVDRWKLARETKILRESWSACHFVQHKSHMNWPGIEPGLLWWGAGNYLGCGMAHNHTCTLFCSEIQRVLAVLSHFIASWTSTI